MTSLGRSLEASIDLNVVCVWDNFMRVPIKSPPSNNFSDFVEHFLLITPRRDAISGFIVKPENNKKYSEYYLQLQITWLSWLKETKYKIASMM